MILKCIMQDLFMNYLLINSHPYLESFHRNASKHIKEILSKKGNCSEIDLILDQFDPTMYAQDLHLWAKGIPCNSLVQSYQQRIEQADVLLFMFPVWWGGIPAVLKGFLDKVLLPGWAYRENSFGILQGKLQPKRAIVISTMHTPGFAFRLYFQNPIKNSLIKGTLKPCGLRIQKYMQIGGLSSSNKKRAQKKMQKILKYFEKLPQ